MALFEGYKAKANSRTDMRRFFVSEGISPHEEWLLDETLPVIFHNQFGSPGQTEVVIGKGMCVSLKPKLAKSFDYGTDLAVMTVADGTNPFVGNVPYNLCRGRLDRFDGNKPNILRRQYVELPWFRRKEEAAVVPHGAVFGDIKPGDHIKVTKEQLEIPGWYGGVRNGLLGKCDKFDASTDDQLQVVGQVLGIEADVEPWGWFKWIMWDEAAKRQDDVYINAGGKDVQAGQAKTPNGADYGFPFDPEYREGRFDINGYFSQFTRKPIGIPGLTDGANREQQSIDIQIPGGTLAGQVLTFTLSYDKVIDGSAKLFIGNTEKAITLDADKGVVTFEADQNYDVAAPAVITFRKEFPGTPTHWDIKGLSGMVRLLLK